LICRVTHWVAPAKTKNNPQNKTKKIKEKLPMGCKTENRFRTGYLEK